MSDHHRKDVRILGRRRGRFFLTGKSHETLIVRSKDFVDTLRVGNRLLRGASRLALLTDNDDYGVAGRPSCAYAQA